MIRHSTISLNTILVYFGMMSDFSEIQIPNEAAFMVKMVVLVLKCRA